MKCQEPKMRLGRLDTSSFTPRVLSARLNSRHLMITTWMTTSRHQLEIMSNTVVSMVLELHWELLGCQRRDSFLGILNPLTCLHHPSLSNSSSTTTKLPISSSKSALMVFQTHGSLPRTSPTTHQGLRTNVTRTQLTKSLLRQLPSFGPTVLGSSPRSWRMEPSLMMLTWSCHTRSSSSPTERHSQRTQAPTSSAT